MSGRVVCITCGRESDSDASRACTNEYEVCGPWEEVVDNYESGIAAGRAAERAAIVAWIRRLPRLGRDDILTPLASRIENGAHEARKGGG